MPLHTRRTLLAASGGAVALLAGCADAGESETEHGEDDEAEARIFQPAELEVRHLWFDTPEQEHNGNSEYTVVESVSAEDEGSESENAPDDTDEEQPDYPLLPYLTTESAAVELSLREEPVDWATQAESETEAEPETETETEIDSEDPLAFLRNLDYEDVTGLIIETDTSACRTQALQYIEQKEGSNRLEVGFCETFRDPDYSCSNDDGQKQVMMVAVPTTFEADPGGFDHGSRNNCQRQPELESDEEGDRE